MKRFLCAVVLILGFAIGSWLVWRPAPTVAPTAGSSSPLPVPPSAQDPHSDVHEGCDPQAHERVTAPAYQPPRVEDPALGILVDRRLTLNERVPPDITSRIPTIRSQADLPVLVGVLKDPTDLDTVRNEIANLLHRTEYPGLRDALFEVLANPVEKPRFRGWAVQHLSGLLVKGPYEQDREQILAHLREGLSDRDLEVRREALLALVRQRDEQAIQAVRTGLRDPSAEAKALRDLAIRCAGELDLRDQTAVLRAFVRDAEESTRIAALVVLSQWGDREIRGACEEASASASVRLQRCGKAALERLNTTSQQHAHPQ